MERRRPACIMGRGRPVRILSITLVALNLPLVWRYLGWEFCFLYASGMGIVLSLFYKLQHKLSPRLLIPIIAASVIAQFISLFFISGIVDNGMDRDSALITFIDSVFSGQNPYQNSTRNGNPISVLPFMPLLAVPFYLIGNIGLLQIFSYLLLVAMLWVEYKSEILPQFYSIFIISTAPLLFFETIARSDLISNVAIVLLLIFLLETRKWNSKSIALFGLLFGCALSTRVALLPCLVLVAFYLFKTLPVHLVLRATAYSIIAMICLILPFAVWNPTIFFGYAPLGVNFHKLGGDYPTKAFWVVLTLAITLLLAVRFNGPRSLYPRTAIIMSIVILATWTTFWLDLSYLQFIFVPLLFTFFRQRERSLIVEHN